MAVTRFSNSGLGAGMTKYDDMLAGYPPLMPAPTAADGGTGTTATVSFTAVTGATSYTALSTPGSFTGTGASSPVTVSGLTAGTAYTFQIRANNSVGNGPYSAASNSVTPVTPTAFDSIATATGTGSSATISFTSIPQTYKHLQIRAFLKGDGSANALRDITIRVNNDVNANYSDHQLKGDGTSVTATGNANQDALSRNVSFVPDGGSAFTSMGAVGIWDIIDYASTTKYKTSRGFYGFNNNTATASQQKIVLDSGSWRNTAAITSIQISNTTNNWTSACSFALYGIKG